MVPGNLKKKSSYLSELLDELIQERKRGALEYEEFLKRVFESAKLSAQPIASKDYPTTLNTSAKRALYDNLDHNEELALEIDTVIRRTKKDGWRGTRIKEREVEYAVKKVLPESYDIKEIFDIIKAQNEY